MSTQVFSFPQQSIPTGEFTLPERAMPESALKLEIRLAFCTTGTPTIWPNAATKLTIKLEVSYDDGATWVGGGGCTGMSGGIQHNKFGAEITAGGFIVTYPQPPDRVRGTLNVTNGPLVTSGSILVN